MSNQNDENGKTRGASSQLCGAAGLRGRWGIGLAVSVMVSSLSGLTGCAGHDESEPAASDRGATSSDENLASTSEAAVSTLNMVLPNGLLPEQVLISATNGAQIGDRARLSGGQITNTGSAELSYGVDARVARARTISVGSVRARGTNDTAAWIDGGIVTANTLIKENHPQVAAPVLEHATITTTNFPRSVDFPSTVGSDVTVQNGVTKSITPGNYNKITVNQNCTLNLAGGKYYIAELTLEAGSKVVYQNASKPVELFIKTKLLFKGKVSEQATGTTAGNVMATYLGTTEAFLESAWLGTLFAPSAQITLGPLNDPAKRHRGAFFGKVVQVRPDTRVEYLRFPSYLITDVLVNPTTVCANQPVAVTVTTRTPSDGTGTLPEVTIDGSLATATATGAKRTIQFAGTGKRKILVTANSGNVSDSRMIDVTIGNCAQKYPRLVVTSSKQAYDVEFQVTNPADVAGTGLKYVWAFGDGQTVETTDPWVSHSYANSINASSADLKFEATLTVKRTGKPDLVVPKTVVVRNMYALMAARGFVRPLVTTNSRLTVNDRALEGAFTLRNVEPGAITFTKQQVQRQFCDPDKAPVNEAPENISVVLAGGATLNRTVKFDRHVFGRDVCGIRVSWTGKAADNVNAVVDINFDTPAVPLVTVPVTDATTKALLNQLATSGTVSNGNRITVDELETLKKKGKISSVPAISAASGGVLGGTEDLVGQPCDPTLAEDHPELSCQATDEWTITPPMVRNGLKGDLILVSACEQIGMMLRKMTPRQIYSHEAMMTRNYFSIAENTAAVTYMMTGADSLGAVLNGDLLKYAWPGSIQQSVATAFGQLDLADPDGNLQVITTLHPDASRCLTEEDPAPPLIVRPRPSDEATVRPTLSKLANWEFDPANHTHYRLFAYSQANIAFEGSDNFSGGSFKSPHDGTPPAVSSSFHWFAAKKNTVPLEGTALETLVRPFGVDQKTSEAELGAILPTGTQGITDGLYRYTVADRRRGAEYIYSSTHNMVTTMQDSILWDQFGFSAGVVGALAEFFTGDVTGQATNIAGQVTSCFGADYCHAGDDPACPCNAVLVGNDEDTGPVYEWVCPPSMTDREQAACSPTYTRENPGEGTAVSPDNFLFWDTPNYGYYEYLSYRSGEFDRVHRWVANPGTTGSCSGNVVDSDGNPVADATVVMQNSSVGTDAAGNFTFTALTAGTYEVKAQAQAQDGTTVFDTDVATVPADGSCDPVTLVLSEDGPFGDMKPVDVAKRKVTFSGHMKITDKESWPFSDEHYEHDISGVCEVSPANRKVVLKSEDLFEGNSNPCAGGEVNSHLVVTCELDENDLNNQNVRVTIKLDSTEGDNCNGSGNIADDPQTDTDNFGPSIVVDAATVNGELHTSMGSAGSADVNVTINNTAGDIITVNPLKEENRRKILIDGTVDLRDSEFIGSNENASDLLHAECYVDPLDPEDEVEWNSSCAGGEVRGVVKITCSLASDGKSVTVKTKGTLYEETTCANNDEDGTTERTTPPIEPCPPGSPNDCTGVSLNAQDNSATIKVDNDDEGGGDFMKITATAKNVQQNIGP